ncbi:MaoC family dehydratase [Nitratireductor basaltis]|uniref:Enoyl-CoA hydratase n=1 Tax=Nitratireductor basaltis TaxID=472175 RepID=A0A084U946_9HYPH|nr:MaoC family dehydratase [Nitratireductor basaltis]KFB09482.1 Enoyl-CoA hydratase [Nitratireductor basaltis]
MNDTTKIPAYRTFEDFEQGAEIDLGSREVSAEEIVEFASEFDPQPMHLNEESGRASLLGGLAASGWHTNAIFMRMMCDAFLLSSSSQGSPGIETLKWKKPVMAGDILSGRSTVIAKRELKSRPELGMVTLRHELRNQHGEVVLQLQNPIMFRKRRDRDDA